jgi:hypothetical protein
MTDKLTGLLLSIKHKEKLTRMPAYRKSLPDRLTLGTVSALSTICGVMREIAKDLCYYQPEVLITY